MSKGGNAKFHITDNQVLNVKNALNNQGNNKVNTVSSKDFQKLLKTPSRNQNLKEAKHLKVFKEDYLQRS